jgi:catechol 2,3-dioxygenase-like lactoylglutathione lyase family enzyme
MKSVTTRRHVMRLASAPAILLLAGQRSASGQTPLPGVIRPRENQTPPATNPASLVAPRLKHAPFPWADPWGNLWLFASDVDGALLRFYKEPYPAPWLVFHEPDARISGTPCATAGPSGDVRVFANGLDGTLREFQQTPARARWTVQDHAGPEGAKLSGDPFALTDRKGDLHIFARSEDGTPLEFYKAQGPANWAVSPLARDAGAIIMDTPHGLSGPDGTIHVFARGPGGALLEFVRAPDQVEWTVDNVSGLTQTVTNAARVDSPLIASAPFVLNVPDADALHVFATGIDGSLVEFVRDPRASRWTSYNLSNIVGAGGVKIAGTPSAWISATGALHVFATSHDGALLEFYAQTAGAWVVYNQSNAARAHGTTIAGPPTIWVNNFGGDVHAFVHLNDGELLEFYKMPNPAQWATSNLTEAAQWRTQPRPAVPPAPIRGKDI